MLLEWLKYPYALKLWILFLVLFPFYVFSSGLPQIADWLLAGLIGIELTKGFKIHHQRFTYALQPLVLLVTYITMVSLAWIPFLDTSDNHRLLQLSFPVFYIYNFFVVWLAVRLYTANGELFLRATLVGLTLTLMLQALLLPISYRGGNRDSLFFNNPNQLGYFSLLALCLFLFVERNLRAPIWIKMCAFTATGMLAAISSSKAAIVAVLALICANLLDAGLVRLHQLAGGALAVALLFVLATNTELGKNLTTSVYDRVETIGSDRDDNLAARGYDRMWLHPQYLLLGAGEGGWDRFYRDPAKRYEMHSSFGTLLFSYGIPGLCLFSLFVYRAFRGMGNAAVLYASPIFMYGMTHMGLRFTLFWIFFAMVLICNDANHRRRLALWRSQLAARAA